MDRPFLRPKKSQIMYKTRPTRASLATLRDLCDVVIDGALEKRRSGRSGLLEEGFAKLRGHVDKAAEIAQRCNGVGIKRSVKRFVLARKISNDIAAVRKDVLAFCSVNNLVLADDTHAKVDQLAADVTGYLKKWTAVLGYLNKWAAVVGCICVGVAVVAAARGYTTGNLVGTPGLDEKIYQTTRNIDENLSRAREEARASGDAEKDLKAMREEVALKTKEKEERDKELEIRDKTSVDLEAELRSSKEALAAMETALEEQRRVADLASRVKVPPGAPRIRDWYVERKAVVGQACDLLGVGSDATDISGKPRMVGLAGPGGAGKSTVASMVIAREDVRASFHKGVLWLPVGQVAKHRLPALMFNLDEMVYETVLRKACRPPRKAGLKNEPEDGAAYIREVVDESSRRFLVVADDVWEVEVLEELKRAGVWVLYTSRDGDLLPEAPAVRLDQVLKEEAEMVLRRAADLADDAKLPDAAYDLMELCEYGVMHLAFVGRWVRGRNDIQAWQAVLDRITNVQEGDEDGKHLPWRAAVLRAGLEELSYDNIQNKELYISLAVSPKGLAFPSEVAAVLLYGADFSTEDRKAAERVVATLERFLILTLERGGEYRVHDDHADFIEGRFAANQETRNRALSRWREYASSVRALLTFTGGWLVEIWEVIARVGGEDVPSRPYDAALGARDPYDDDLPDAYRTLADYHWLLGDWQEPWPVGFNLWAPGQGRSRS